MLWSGLDDDLELLGLRIEPETEHLQDIEAQDYVEIGIIRHIDHFIGILDREERRFAVLEISRRAAILYSLGPKSDQG